MLIQLVCDHNIVLPQPTTAHLVLNQLKIWSDSSTKDFVFTMTFKHDSRIWHFRIKEKEHKFAFHNTNLMTQYFPTVMELLENYQKSSIPSKPRIPALRKNPFSLRTLSKATVWESVQYRDISKLPNFPKALKEELCQKHTYSHGETELVKCTRKEHSEKVCDIYKYFQ